MPKKKTTKGSKAEDKGKGKGADIEDESTNANDGATDMADESTDTDTKGEGLNVLDALQEEGENSQEVDLDVDNNESPAAATEAEAHSSEHVDEEPATEQEQGQPLTIEQQVEKHLLNYSQSMDELVWSLATELDSLKFEVNHLQRRIGEIELTIPVIKSGIFTREEKRPKKRKVQVRDRVTGTLYPSKNNCYQTLLKEGQLQELVTQGIFGAEPEKNSFGAFALFRALPDRFEVISVENGDYS